MSALKLACRLLWKLWVIIRSAPPSAAAPPIDMPVNSPIYNQEHLFVWPHGPEDEPPGSPWCVVCRQLQATASRYCPGMPRDA